MSRIYDSSICVLRKSQGENAMNLKRLDSASDTCQDGYKLCGTKEGATQMNFYNLTCIPENNDCPVNDVQIVDKDFILPTDYVEVPFPNQPMKLIYTTVAEKMPIVEFKVA